MGGFEHSESEKQAKPGSEQQSAELAAARIEALPEQELKSAKPSELNKRESALFGGKEGFSFADFDKKEESKKESNQKSDASGKSENPELKNAKAKETKTRDSNNDSELLQKLGDHKSIQFSDLDSKEGNAAKEDKIARNLKASKDMDDLIDNARKFWQESSDQGSKEGGFLGHAQALAAEAMQLGVSAFDKGHELMKEAFPEGVIEPSRQFWQEAAKNGEVEGGVKGRSKELAAKAMDGLLALSGLAHVEDGLTNVTSDLHDGVPLEQLKHDAGWLAVDTALAAATFVPGLTALKGMAKGEALFRTAQAGTEIAGMAAAEARVTGSVASKLSQAVKEALPEAGESLGKENMGKFIGKLQEFGKKYGIELKEGGVVGESTGGINAIEYSSKAGGPHEIAHVLQQLQTRATALEAQAAKSGKTVAELSQVERAEAFKQMVKPFEDVAYNQHEMWAGQAHSWGKTAANYAEVLQANISSFEKALTTGRVPEAIVGTASKFYGALPNWLGRSQAAIARNLGVPTSSTVGQVFEAKWKDKI